MQAGFIFLEESAYFLAADFNRKYQLRQKFSKQNKFRILE
jgi:hypothetical protein